MDTKVETASSIRLSPSALNLFLDCPRCFWLEKVKNIKRPRGIFPSLPSGMDRVIKDYFDTARSKGKLPPELTGPDFEGVELYQDQAKLNLWRNWRTGLACQDTDKSVLFGALDDLLVKGDRYIPFDYKTKGSPTTEEDAVKYYQNQIDCYALLLHANKMPAVGYGFLLYFSPKAVSENGQVQFTIQPIKIQIDIERAKSTFRRAVNLIKGAMPASAGKCEYCAWINQMNRNSHVSE